MPGISKLAAAAAYALAGLSGCPAPPPPEVAVELHASDPTLDTSMTRAELTAGFADNPDSSLATEPGWHIGGLALSNVQVRTGAQFQEVIMSDNSGCFWVHKINFDIVYTPVIFIASDYLHDECRYTLTLAHEQRHVGTDLKTFNDFTPAIQDALRRVGSAYGAMGPYPAAQLQQMAQQVVDHISDQAQPVVEQLTKVRRQRQAQFDTESNYRYESALCEGGRR